LDEMLGEWCDPNRVEEYLGREIPHRGLAETMLLEALPARVARFLDLGTGDGRLAALMVSRYPRARGVGLDSSSPMLARAAERFADHAAVELLDHDLDRPIALDGPFEAIVSGLAIHHLSDARKRSLFTEIHTLLGSGGVFANLDIVASASRAEHERFRRAIGREREDPSDRLAALCDQLEWLRDCGFAEVDCHFKWLELALIVARRD
jgi:cyclopropane fatty-acyl-phospholipid synthase-like methyltransferase